MSFCLPFAYWKEYQEKQQAQKEDLETPLVAAQVRHGVVWWVWHEHPRLHSVGGGGGPALPAATQTTTLQHSAAHTTPLGRRHRVWQPA
jgi:hypothetical protein